MASGSSVWLFNAPTYPDSIHWSENNLLAVGTGQVTVILNPFNLNGARAYVPPIEAPDLSSYQPKCVPQDPDSSLTHSLACLTELVLMRDSQWRPLVRSLSWSPAGCAPNGGCLLATVLSDHQVHLCTAPLEKYSPQWIRVVDLSKPLKEHMKIMRWEEDMVESDQEEMEGLRLRGGGKSRRQITPSKRPKMGQVRENISSLFAIDRQVEVMNDKEGLRGAWFPGVIMEVSGGYALVKYRDLNPDGRKKNRLKEWFLMPGQSPNRSEKIKKSGHPVHEEPGCILRPKPPDDMCEFSLASSNVGDLAEMYEDGYWLPVYIVSNLKSKIVVETTHTYIKKKLFNPGNLRKALKWKPNGSWEKYLGNLYKPESKQMAPSLTGIEETAGQSEPICIDLTKESPPSPDKPVTVNQQGTAAGPSFLNMDTDALDDPFIGATGDVLDGPGQGQPPERPTVNLYETLTQLPTSSLAPSGVGEGRDAELDHIMEVAGDDMGGHEKAASVQVPIEPDQSTPSAAPFLAACVQQTDGLMEECVDIPVDDVEHIQPSIQHSQQDQEAGETLPRTREGESAPSGSFAQPEHPTNVESQQAMDIPGEQVGGRSTTPEVSIPLEASPHLPEPPGEYAGASTSGACLVEPKTESRSKRTRREQEAQDVEMETPSRPTESENLTEGGAGRRNVDDASVRSGTGGRGRGGRGRGGRGGATASGRGSSAAGSSNRSSRSGKRSRVPVDLPPPYQIPDDFDPSVLARVNETDMNTFRVQLGRVGLARWMELRVKVPHEQIPTYRSREQLKGVDMEIMERVRAEVMHVYGDKIKQFGKEEHWIIKEIRAHIRKKAICSSAAYFRADSLKMHKNQSVLGLIGHDRLTLRSATKRKRSESGQQKGNGNQDEEGDDDYVPSDDEEDEDWGANLDDMFPPLPNQGPSRKPGRGRGRIGHSQVVTSDSACIVVGSTLQTVRPTATKSRKSRKNAAKYLRITLGETVPNPVYENRMRLMAAGCVAWSPMIEENSQKYALLGVGTESGHIVFWKYKMPGITPQPVYADVQRHISLVGSMKVHTTGGVSCLRWHIVGKGGRKYVLVVSGSPFGEVKMIGFKPNEILSFVGREGKRFVAEEHVWGWICAIDMQPVGCLSVEMGCQGKHLRVAYGKTGGEVGVWESPDVDRLSDMEPVEWLRKGELCRISKAHGAFGITGIVCGLVNDLVSTSGVDGSVRCWKKRGSEMAEVFNPQVVRGVKNTKCKAPFGIAASHNGLVLAVLRDLGRKHMDVQEHKMTWMRVCHATVEIMRLHGFGAPVPYCEALSWLVTGKKLITGSLSDVVFVLLMGNAETQKAGASKSSTPAPSVDSGSAWDSEKEGSEGDNEPQEDEMREVIDDEDQYVIGEEVAKQVKEVIEKLESGFWQAVPPKRSGGSSRSRKELMDGLMGLSSQARTSLQMAVALRHLLLRKAQRTALPDSFTGPILDKDQLAKLEFCLLQLHIFSVLSSANCPCPEHLESLKDVAGSSEEVDAWKFLRTTMSRWVVQHKEKEGMSSKLIKTAKKVLEGVGDSLPEIVWVSEEPVKFLPDDPVASARTALVSVEGEDLYLSRCSSTLLTGQETFPWNCKICLRRYGIPPQVLLGQTDCFPCCVFCGARLSFGGNGALAEPGIYMEAL